MLCAEAHVLAARIDAVENQAGRLHLAHLAGLDVDQPVDPRRDSVALVAVLDHLLVEPKATVFAAPSERCTDLGGRAHGDDIADSERLPGSFHSVLRNGNHGKTEPAMLRLNCIEEPREHRHTNARNVTLPASSGRKSWKTSPGHNGLLAAWSCVNWHTNLSGTVLLSTVELAMGAVGAALGSRCGSPRWRSHSTRHSR